MHELAKLIQDRRGDQSYGDLARRSGGALTRAGLQRIGAGSEPLRELPKPETLHALARALGVSIDLVAVAALRSAGVPVRDRFGQPGGGLESLADILTDRQRSALVAVAEAMAYPHGEPAPADIPYKGSQRVASADAGVLVEEARKRGKLSVRDAAVDAHVSAKDWRRIVAGEQAADADTWTDLAVAAGASYEEVLATVGLPIPGQEDEQPITKGHDTAV